MRHHLFLLSELVKRDFKGRYAGSILGFVWSFVQPLWLLLLFTFVFGTIMRLSLLGERTESFGVFLFAGLVPWMAVQEGLQRGSAAITDNAELVRKLSFPSEVLVLTVVLAALLHEGIALGLFVVVLAVLGELAPLSLPWLLVAVPLQVALTLGLGLLLASFNVFFRDTSQILGMVLTGWFYVTPIVYPYGLVPERYQWVLDVNPLTPLVELYRQALLGGGGGLPAGFPGLLATSAGALVVGFAAFRRLKPAFVDEV
jgi:ABC-type polysaccharide/polyol phosphate export permease